MLNEKWDRRFLEMARLISTWSKDRSGGVGAVVVGPDKDVRSTGFNGFPPSVDESPEERHVRPEKYYWVEHAERNALYFAAANGASLRGCTLYSSMFPCPDCARGIIRAGLVRVVCPPAPTPLGTPGDWRAACAHSATMFQEAGLVLSLYPEER